MKIKLKIYNNRTFFEILNCSTQEESKFINTLTDICTHTYTQYFKTRWMRKGEFQIKTLLLRGKDWVPTGLLLDIIQSSGFDESDFIIEDFREFKEYQAQPYQFNFKLDDSQIESIKEGIEFRRGYYSAATGAGKTALIISLACELGGRSLILVPSIDLVSQIAEDFEKYTNLKPIKIQGIKSFDKINYEEFHSENLIAIASIPTIWSNFEELQKINFFNHFNCVFGDEIHHVGIKKGSKGIPTTTNSYYQILLELNAYNRFGFSGSIDDDKLIRAVTGRLLKETTEDYLIGEGRLSKPFIYLLNIDVPFEAEYRDAYQKHILENQERNEKALEIVKALEQLNLSTLILMDSKQIQLQELFKLSGYNYTVGGTKTKLRKELYDKLNNKEILVLLSTVSKEGVNIPNVDCILRVGGIKSVNRIKQEKGRGSRVGTNKSSYFLIDFFDDDKSKAIYDPVDKEFKTKRGYLKKHSKARLNFYKTIKMAEIGIFDTVGELINKVKEVIK